MRLQGISYCIYFHEIKKEVRKEMRSRQEGRRNEDKKRERKKNQTITEIHPRTLYIKLINISAGHVL
jgi:hypothetical protein